jgi:hypothetical protein
MRLEFSIPCIALVLSLGTVAVESASVRAAGCYNMPGNFCQCIGCGCGGGYHAPLVLGPIRCDGFFTRNQVRLPCAPCATCSCWDCNCVSVRPTTMEGFVSTEAAHPATRAPVRLRPQSRNVQETLPGSPVEQSLPEEKDVQPSTTLPAPERQGTAPGAPQPNIAEPEKATSLIPPPNMIHAVFATRAEAQRPSLFDRPIQP